MKKLLLMLVAILSMATFARAEEVTTLTLKSVDSPNPDFSLVFSKGTGSTAPSFYSPSVRLYGGNTLTITAAEGIEMTKVVLSSTETKNNTFNNGSTVTDASGLSIGQSLINISNTTRRS